MKSYNYYRHSSRQVGLRDHKGRFAGMAFNQIEAETEFTHERLHNAYDDITTTPKRARTAVLICDTALKWRVSGVQLLKQLRKEVV